jgi:ribosomal-protein-alanine N-acetyltransferase
MSTEHASPAAIDWRADLPPLSGRRITLHEPTPDDVGALVGLLSTADAPPFGLDESATETSVRDLVDRWARERSRGQAFTYGVTIDATRLLVGLFSVRQLDPAFEAGEWEFTVAPSMRGTGVFLEAALLVGAFAFGSVGARRLEARVPVQNARGHGALRKLGAVQEGVLRRSLRRDDRFFDQALWSILKDDWGEAWRSAAPLVH